MAAGPSGCALHVVAHQDDDLLFQSPALLQEVRGGCVRTVFLTAGDAGNEEWYWSARERGAQSAYAEMAGVADDWATSERTVAGRRVVERTLVGRPDVSLLFLRLPDGLYAGTGSQQYGSQSLRRLWQSAPASGPGSATASSVDGAAAYDRQGVVDVLRAVMNDVQPRLIAAQDWTEPFGDGNQSDHADHVAAALFAREAAGAYTTPHVLRAYQDYPSGARDVNLSGALLKAKQSAFYAYARHDFLCRDDASCDTDPDYGAWLKRQYVMDTRTVGVVADAGYAQEAVAGATVRLDGSASATATGAPRTYRWTQTAGPTVTLKNATTATPTFQVPASPSNPASRAVLTFALVVSDGTTSSASNAVSVRPTRPVADAGSSQSVASQAAVTLNAGKSRDPDAGGAALTYEWTQLTGSPVVLARPTTATPTFKAPAGPASLRFSLVVRSGNRSSFPVPVTVTVAPPSAATTNLAGEATASASSEAPWQEAEYAIDGSLDGLEAPDYVVQNEWSSAGEGAGATLTLTWDRDVSLGHLELFDRPNGVDRITSGTLQFSDGSKVPFGALPRNGRSPLSDFLALRDDARRGLTVAFSSRRTRSVRITVNTVASGTLNVGLSEVRAWGVPAS